MNEFLQYLLNSAICLSVLYLLFRALLRKEAFFKLNRIILLSIVLCSLVIPKLIMPQMIHQTIQQPIELQLPVFKAEVSNLQEVPETDKIVLKAETVRSSFFSIQEMLVYLYITGLLITFLILVYGLVSILSLYRKAKVIPMDDYRLLIVEKEITAFSFGHLVFISRHDYEDHQRVILAHEKEHIRFGHFYDLLFLEAIKLIYWFNPFIYWLIRDLKDIHEFQVDDHTLTKDIDAKQYQLLIIQKSVGHQKFALANSFNHCQIKNRIVMMNKLKTSKAWRWKAAAFLPLLALLLMAFGKPGEKKDSEEKMSPEIAISQDSVKTPEHYHLMILVDAKGKVSLNMNGLDNRQKVLTKMGEDYNIVFSPKELEAFSEINSFSVPMYLMKWLLNMPAEKRNKTKNDPGIPFNSDNSEFKNWVSTARAVDKDMRIDIKGDPAVSYGVINKLIVQLQDLHENRYNFLLAKPKKAYEIPFLSKTGGPGKFSQSSVLDYARSSPRAITVILDKDNSVYYYLGSAEKLSLHF